MATQVDMGPLPLVLGVTGHRDLRPEDRQRLSEVVRSVLADYRRRMPYTPIVLLSPLADGADRLVATLALEAGFGLIAGLPMPVEDFKSTLADEQARAEFDDLLARSSTSFTVPFLNGSLESSSASADLLYANCGAYVATRCTELIALWDGTDQQSAAGTAQDVRFMLDGVGEPLVPPGYDLDPGLTGPVVHIVTPRISNPNPGGHSFSVRRLFPQFAGTQVDLAEEYDRVLERIEYYNADALIARRRVPWETPVSDDCLLQLTEHLSGKYQRRTRGVMLSILAAVFVAVASFNLYTVGILPTLGILIIYIAASALAFLIYRTGRRQGWEDRYQDYRSFAEAVRVSKVWRCAGIPVSVAGEVQRMERGEIDWLPIAIRSIMEPWFDVRTEAPVLMLNTIFTTWVADQDAWYAKRVREKRRYSSRTALAATALFVVAGAATLAIALSPAMFGNEMFKRYVVLGSGLLTGLSALASYYAEKRGWAEEAKEYIRVGMLFSRACSKMPHLLAATATSNQAAPRIKAMIYDLGREALRENISWRNLHRQRPIKIPHG